MNSFFFLRNACTPICTPKVPSNQKKNYNLDFTPISLYPVLGIALNFTPKFTSFAKAGKSQFVDVTVTTGITEYV